MNEKQRRRSITVSPNIFDLLPKFACRRWVVNGYPSPITHEQQYFSQKCPVVSIANPIKKEQMTNYNN